MPIQVSDSEISRRHAEIRKDDEGYLLVDLGSSNGTFVNAEQVTERRLVNGDRVQLGRTLLLFTDADERNEPAAGSRSRYRRRARPRRLANRQIGEPRIRAAACLPPTPPTAPGSPPPAATCRSCIARLWPSATRSISTSS